MDNYCDRNFLAGIPVANLGADNFLPFIPDELMSFAEKGIRTYGQNSQWQIFKQYLHSLYTVTPISMTETNGLADILFDKLYLDLQLQKLSPIIYFC